ncbi:MAG: hypothetical protein AAB402_03180 [Patescibacteria group bacterium]
MALKFPGWRPVAAALNIIVVGTIVVALIIGALWSILTHFNNPVVRIVGSALGLSAIGYGLWMWRPSPSVVKRLQGWWQHSSGWQKTFPLTIIVAVILATKLKNASTQITLLHFNWPRLSSHDMLFWGAWIGGSVALVTLVVWFRQRRKVKSTGTSSSTQPKPVIPKTGGVWQGFFNTVEGLIWICLSVGLLVWIIAVFLSQRPPILPLYVLFGGLVLVTAAQWVLFRNVPVGAPSPIKNLLPVALFGAVIIIVGMWVMNNVTHPAPGKPSSMIPSSWIMGKK